jgi:hypothetical protein
MYVAGTFFIERFVQTVVFCGQKEEETTVKFVTAE